MLVCHCMLSMEILKLQNMEISLHTFLAEKATFLKKVDFSRKGSVDEDIADIVNNINSHDDYFTTSSCSGRLVAFVEVENQRKKNCEWLFNSHKAVDSVTFRKVLDSYFQTLQTSRGKASGVIWLKFEPLIIHVRCRSLQAAKKLLNLALNAGCRNSGVMIGKRLRLTVALRSTLTLALPLQHTDQVQMLSDEYFEFLFQTINIKFTENDQLCSKVRKYLVHIL
ncbi:tRNA wybutosine-synthesizing protein 3 -like protein [Trichinella pseudospiralis]|uniref:tRNA wybutosine-synthesizing protein 3 homolog n=2 Tax=Trichinella pseudospiralis TaxID=6337 RepID=A0A0V1JMJ2_TRIPS|nr:tRNA wybutosine-synthesizing protein 3 -like protein [Trichinella pseudospiralis]KRZ24194.1 tRNA wybutosine-synthesizing protein 3 -like protein [Trichinella pseudospiralis]KRZ36196.1 tRNA wybutosine-synthesizing protein 3 -like protein [Trichinella pseudospiralis]